MVENTECMQHSGICEAVNQCKKNDDVLFKKFDDLQKVVYRAAGAIVVLTPIFVVLLQRVFK